MGYQYFEQDDPDLYLSKVKYILENDVEEMELYFVEEEYDNDGQLLKVEVVDAPSVLQRVHFERDITINSVVSGSGINSRRQQGPSDQRHQAPLPGRSRSAPAGQLHSQRSRSFLTRPQRTDSRQSLRDIRRE